MCPALILAANRKASVKGRTLILIVSIITRKGFNQVGAPPGSKVATVLYGALVTDDIIIPSQRGRANTNVNDKWVVVENE